MATPGHAGRREKMAMARQFAPFERAMQPVGENMTRVASQQASGLEQAYQETMERLQTNTRQTRASITPETIERHITEHHNSIRTEDSRQVMSRRHQTTDLRINTFIKPDYQALHDIVKEVKEIYKIVKQNKNQSAINTIMDLLMELEQSVEEAQAEIMHQVENMSIILNGDYGGRFVRSYPPTASGNWKDFYRQLFNNQLMHYDEFIEQLLGASITASFRTSQINQANKESCMQALIGASVDQNQLYQAFQNLEQEYGALEAAATGRQDTLNVTPPIFSPGVDPSPDNTRRRLD